MNTVHGQAQTWFERMDACELPLCLFFNRAVRKRVPHLVCRTASRLGDGVFWYVLMACLPLVHGPAALIAAGHMAATGVVAVGLYLFLKRRIGRPRPCERHRTIRVGAIPLDRWSFPSGHTLHAVSFTIVLLSHYPAWSCIAVPFTLLVALSRMVLGLHYATDVLAGALIGAAVSLASVTAF